MKVQRVTRLFTLVVACACLQSGCGGPNGGGMFKKSLYARLGGEEAIRKVVKDFVGRAAADPQVKFARAGTPKEWKATPENVAKLERLLTEMICQAAGGPQKYSGRDMKTVHAGMGITNREFMALAGDLKASLDKYMIAEKDQNELMNIIGATRGDIVEKMEPIPDPQK